MNNKNILICVSGLTPQIVSETFFCLSVQKNIKIDEIYILTTKRGREVILGLDKAPQTPKTPLKTELENLCKLYNLNVPTFDYNDKHIIVAKEESLELSDIRSDEHNVLFPNKVCEFIRKISLNPDMILHCSISGGRKTMSVHMATALSLFGRERDKLYHVLTNEGNEFKAFYPTSQKESENLELSEIPYIRLRSIISSQISTTKFEKMKYDEIVKFTQSQLKKSSFKGVMQLISDEKEIRFSEHSIRLEPMEYAIYHFFVESKLEGNPKLDIHHLTTQEVALRILEFIKTYYPYYDSKLKQAHPWWKTGFNAEEFRSKISKINKKISELIQDPDIREEFLVSSFRKYSNTSYGIKADKNKFRLSIPY